MLARRLDERLDSIERIIAADNPGWNSDGALAAPHQLRELPQTQRAPLRPPANIRDRTCLLVAHASISTNAMAASWGSAPGVADYFGIDALWVRIGFVATLFLLFPPIFFLYFYFGWFADPMPREVYDDTPDERQFWAKVRVAPQRTMRDVRSSFRDADRRLRDIEAYMTSSNSRLANEIDQLR